MINKTLIGVVVPAYNEEKLIGKTIDTMPDFVDHIILVNDCSKDKTLEIMKQRADKDARIFIISNKKNMGLGRTISIGYEKARSLEINVTAVMAGDAQMDPNDLINVISPILEKKADYVKGNRLFHENIKNSMPRFRLFGNAILTILTKFATGYWHLLDPQCGYTAISLNALKSLDLKKLHKGYGYNADYLTKLNIMNFKVADVTVNPVYGKEVSGIKYGTYIPKVSFLLLKLFFYRLKEKYLIRDFHPVILLYSLGILTTISGLTYGTYLFYLDQFNNFTPTAGTTIFVAFLLLFGIQSIIFAMLFDSLYNKQ